MTGQQAIVTYKQVMESITAYKPVGECDYFDIGYTYPSDSEIDRLWKPKYMQKPWKNEGR